MDEEYTDKKFPKKRIRRWRIGWHSNFWNVPDVIFELEEKEGYEPIINIYNNNKKIISNDTCMDKGWLDIKKLEQALREYKKSQKLNAL